jgi:hypothetical protein
MGPIKLIAQLKEIKHTKDGGTRIVLECGKESLPDVQKLEILNSTGDTNLGIAIVPVE